MNQRRPNSQRSGSPLGRLLLATALAAVVFSVGLIAGQRMLVERSLSPVVSAGEPANDLSPLPGESGADETGDGENDLFSFYEVLTNAEIQQIIDVHDSPSPSRAEPLEDDREPQAQDVADDASPEDDSGLADLPIDDEAQPQTDDGREPARYTLQVAAHPSRERARTEMDRLQDMALDPHVVAADVPGRGKFYRVRIGKFATEAQARTHRERVQSEHGVDTFITPL